MDIQNRNPAAAERSEQSSAEYRRLLKQEKFILEVTEALSRAIEESGVTRSEVAKRLGKTKGFVSQLLGGGRNLTLRTVADLSDAIGVCLKVAVEHPEIAKPAEGRHWTNLLLGSAMRWSTEHKGSIRRHTAAVDLRATAEWRLEKYEIYGQVGHKAEGDVEQMAA